MQDADPHDVDRSGPLRRAHRESDPEACAGSESGGANRVILTTRTETPAALLPICAASTPARHRTRPGSNSSAYARRVWAVVEKTSTSASASVLPLVNVRPASPVQVSAARL